MRILSNKNTNLKSISKKYLSGPGSHIKGLALELSNRMKIETENLSTIIESHLIERKTSKKLAWGFLKGIPYSVRKKILQQGLIN